MAAGAVSFPAVSSRSVTPEHAQPAAQSDARWFAEEVQPHEQMLRAYLKKEFPRLADLDDVVQESHLRLIKARKGAPIASAKAYLFAVARNVAFGVFRKRRIFSEVSVSDLSEVCLLDTARGIADAVSANQEVALATEAIDGLPARCREIVILRTLHGLPHGEIAQKLGLSEQTVRVQVARGMKKCAEFLRRHGINGPNRDETV